MSEHEWLNTEQAARMFSDQWRLRALAYEQALREIGAKAHEALARGFDTSDLIGALQEIAARAALDKPEGK